MQNATPNQPATGQPATQTGQPATGQPTNPQPPTGQTGQPNTPLQATATQPPTGQPQPGKPGKPGKTRKTAKKPATGQPPQNAPFYGIAGVCMYCGKPTATGQPGHVCLANQKLPPKGHYHKPLPPTAVIAPTPPLMVKGKMQPYNLVAKYPTGATHVSVVQFCNIAQTLGKGRAYACKLSGGTTGNKPPTNPIFTVYTLGNRHYIAVGAIAALTQLAKTGKMA